MRAPVETELPRSTRSGDLVSEVIHDARRLVNLEIALAKREIKDLFVANAIAAGMVAFGGLLAVLAVLVAIPTLIVALVPWHWQAAVAWIVLYMGIGIGLVLAGRARLVFKLPARTLNSLKGEQGMGTSADQIDRQIKETREQTDEKLGVLEQHAASKAARYGKIAAVVVGVGAVATAGVLIYRRLNRPTRSEQLRSMLVEALKDLPDSLKSLPDEVATKLKSRSLRARWS